MLKIKINIIQHTCSFKCERLTLIIEGQKDCQILLNKILFQITK